MARKSEEGQEGTTVVTKQGRVTLPAWIRQQYGLSEGTTMYVHIDPDDGAVRLETWDQRAKRIRSKIASELTDAGSLAQSLAADRHDEFLKEEGTA